VVGHQVRGYPVAPGGGGVAGQVAAATGYIAAPRYCKRPEPSLIVEVQRHRAATRLLGPPGRSSRGKSIFWTVADKSLPAGLALKIISSG